MLLSPSSIVYERISFQKIFKIYCIEKNYYRQCKNCKYALESVTARKSSKKGKIMN
ncbi:MAG: hypothetical protein JG775_2629 [Defluviitaleaceae bacterium]|nr:hypothetical protein [Defluviitaleaceae bacterium]